MALQRSGLVAFLYFATVITAELTVTPNGYDEEEARTLASISSATYCDNVKSVLGWSCTACRDSKVELARGKIRIIDDGYSNATRVLVGKFQHQQGCLVAYRGSDNLVNWMYDARFWKTIPRFFPECDGCMVHLGFYNVWASVHDDVVAALQELGCSNSSTNPDNSLHITGHSLGAALTHLAIFKFANAGFNIVKAYSFEAPRVGNLAFVHAFANRFSSKFAIYRVTHAEDPAVHYPPWALGYVHIQTEVFYDSDGKYTICPRIEDEHCSGQYHNMLDMITFHAGDHCKSPLVPNGDICNPVGCEGDSSVLIV